MVVVLQFSIVLVKSGNTFSFTPKKGKKLNIHIGYIVLQLADLVIKLPHKKKDYVVTHENTSVF